uniref:H0211A12.14 protein n=1 Tax=Oryza sativa TaxID=4530 RepID=Q01KW0_ORYSA|nr:H0211A12.14 [Oryza sativa]
MAMSGLPSNIEVTASQLTAIMDQLKRMEATMADHTIAISRLDNKIAEVDTKGIVGTKPSASNQHQHDGTTDSRHTVEDEKIWIAAFHLTDEAQECYTHAEEAYGTPLWRRFKEMVELRFGPPLRHNKLGTLAELRRAGSVADYQEKFMSLLSRAGPLMEVQKIELFTAGLQGKLRIDVELEAPALLDTAMSLARAYELRVQIEDPVPIEPAKPPARAPATRPAASPAAPHVAPIAAVASAPAAPAAAARAAAPVRAARVARRTLTPEEMQSQCEAGLCFNCDEKFTPGHRCKRLFWLYAPSADDNETNPPNAEDGDPGISLYAMAGVRLPGSETMQLHITINGKRLVALLDSGSTHNFINADVATDPSMLLSPCHGLRIIWDFTKLQLTLTRAGCQITWLSIGAPIDKPCEHAFACSGPDVLAGLLEEFATIFVEPRGLPSQCNHDHHIHLLPDSRPVAVRLYRYAQHQKDELERQCADMLSQGII